MEEQTFSTIVRDSHLMIFRLPTNTLLGQYERKKKS